MFLNYIQVAFRQLLRRKTFSIINIGGLALSLVSCIFIFYFVYDELTYDRHNEHADRIHRLTIVFKTPDNEQNLLWTHQKIGPYFKRVYPQVEEFVRFADVEAKFGASKLTEPGVVIADASVFSVFTYPFLEGNPNTALQHPKSIVLSETLAKKYFHGMAMGQTVDLQGVPFIVTGVMKDAPSNSDKWVSAIASDDMGSEADEQLSFMYETYILLKDPSHTSFVRSQLNTAAGTLHRKMGDVEYKLDMQALTSLHFWHGTGMDHPKGNEANTIILAVVAVTLLIVALFNFINLTTVVSLERAKEVGIRKVAGAQKFELIRQFLAESGLSVFLAALLGSITMFVLSSIFENVSGKTISFDKESDQLIVGLIVTILIAVALFSSFYPAWILSSYRPIKALKKDIRVTSGNVVRRVLVITQFALSTALLIFLTTILVQTDFMQNSDKGFTTDKIVVVHLPEDSVSQAHAPFIRNEFLNESSVKAVAIGGFGSTPGTKEVVASPLTIFVNGEKRDPIVANIVADKHYTSMLGLNAMVGESFHDIGNESAQGKAVINESFAKLAGWKNPIGETVTTYGGTAKVIGVIPDFHFKSLHNKIDPLVIMGQNEQQPDARYLYIQTNSNDIEQLSVTWNKLFPGQPFDYQFLNSYFDEQYRSEQILQSIFLYFTFLTILIASSGLLALTMYHVDSKTKEISIRKVLGANTSSLIQLLSKGFFRLTLVGIVIGIGAGALISSEWLAGFAYHVSLGVVTIVFPVVLITIVSLVILVYKTYRGAVSNPVTGLRYE